MMHNLQVTDRLKEAPAMVLRTVFAGIGQLLMAADKVRAQLEERLAPPAPHRPPAGRAEASRQQREAAGTVTVLADRHVPGGQREHARPTSAAASATRPAAAQRTAGRPAAATRPAPAQRTAARPAAAKPAASQPARARRTPANPAAARLAAAEPARAQRTPAKPAASKPAARPAPARRAAAPAPASPAASPAPVPPLAGYDDLPVASLRARMRGLDQDGLHALLDYERATAHRDNVIAMYERRLAKLAGETG